MVDLERLSAMLSMMSEAKEHWRSFLALREGGREGGSVRRRRGICDHLLGYQRGWICKESFNLVQGKHGSSQ